MSIIPPATAYPLKWPDGWPRARSRLSNHPFKTRSEPITFERARRSLTEELKRLGASALVLSSNVPLRNDGFPFADAARRRMDDPGVAIYFQLKRRPMVMAQDRYYDVAANMRSLAMAIDAMRALERHGGGTMMERAFTGFSALPAPEGYKAKRPWWEVLRYSENAEDRELLSVAEVDARFKTLAKRLHPDQGGGVSEMAELNQARADAVAELEAAGGGNAG